MPVPTQFRHIHIHPTVITPVVNKRDDELNAVFLGGAHYDIKATETVGVVIDAGGRGGPALEVDAGAVGGVVEAPGAYVCEAGALSGCQGEVDVGVGGEEREPVGVGAGEGGECCAGDKGGCEGEGQEKEGEEGLEIHGNGGSEGSDGE